jgi:hypothetical protein
MAIALFLNRIAVRQKNGSVPSITSGTYSRSV